MPVQLNQLSIEELEAYEGPEVRVDSAELFESDEKWKLLGVRHYITKVTYRPTLMEGELSDYVSVEARIASAAVLELRIKQERIPNIRSLDQLVELGVEPGGSIVYNDGSTGIRQQLTYMFHSMGVITVGNIAPQDVHSKNKEFTKPFSEWDSVGDQFYLGEFEGNDFKAPDIHMRDQQNPLLIKALGGLRVSDYTYDGRPAQTYYIN
jgi:hypothetical protein